MIVRIRIGARPPSTGDLGTAPTTETVRINTRVSRIERATAFLPDVTHYLVRKTIGLARHLILIERVT
jgi:hypothetical protein